MTAARNAALGLCIAPHRMVARALSGGASSRVSWERPLGGDDIVPGTPAWRAQLDDALRALRTTAPLSRELHVALAPPLAEVRVVALPTIGPLELGAAVERDAAKYFPVGAERQVIAVRTVGVATSGFAPHLVSAAAAVVVGDVLAAAAAAGFQVASIAPAQVAWVRSAAQSKAGAFGAPVRAMGTDRDATRSLLVRLDGRDDLFDVLDGDIVRVQH